jgi:hypothetical protein
MRVFASLLIALSLGGCASLKELWPRAHDPVLVDRWVDTQIAIERVDCASKPIRGWDVATDSSERLARLSEFRADPQARNMRGLADLIKTAAGRDSKTFCELSVKLAQDRLRAARSAWEGR